MKKFTLLTVCAAAALCASAVNHKPMVTLPANFQKAELQQFVATPVNHANVVSVNKNVTRTPFKGPKKTIVGADISYIAPLGTLYYFPDPVSSQGFTIFQLPAYVENTWINMSPASLGQTATWEADDYYSFYGGTGEYDTYDLTTMFLSFPKGYTTPAPTLSMKGEEYQLHAKTRAGDRPMNFAAGGDMIYEEDGETIENFGTNCNSWASAEPGVDTYSIYITNINGFSGDPEEENQYWTEMLAEAEGDKVELVGFSEYFPYGGRPYTLNKVSVPSASVGCEQGAVVKCVVVKHTEEGSVELASAEYVLPKCETTEDPMYGTQGEEVDNEIFDFIDPLTGEGLAIDSDIEVKIYLTDPKITYYQCPSFFVTDATAAATYEGLNFGTTLFNYTEYQGETTERYIPISSWSWGQGNPMIGISNIIAINVTHDFVEAVYNEDLSVFERPAMYDLTDLEEPFTEEAPGYLIFTASSAIEDLGWEYDVKDEDGNDIEWCSIVDAEDYMMSDIYGEGYPTDLYSKYSALHFTCDVLPDGVEGRGAVVRVKVGADEVKAYIIQGDWMPSGVQGVKVDVAEKAGKVVRDGENFNIEGAAGATVYSASGAVVASTKGNTINAQSWSNGVYLVRLSNGKTVKVVK